MINLQGQLLQYWRKLKLWQQDLMPQLMMMNVIIFGLKNLVLKNRDLMIVMDPLKSVTKTGN